MAILKLISVENTTGFPAFTIDTSGRVILNRVKVPVFNGTPSSPVAGELIFNSSTLKLSFYDGSAWK